MGQDEFDKLVTKVETKAQRNPKLYQIKLLAYVFFGYFYVLGILLLLCTIIGAIVGAIFFNTGFILIAKQVLIPLAILTGLIVKSLWVKFSSPEGVELKKVDYPELFDQIDFIRKSAKAPKPDVVLLTSELNASIVQLPRLGIFGWHKNYLILGFPLMQFLSLKEFNAVLAHEFGHLSASHGRLGAIVYRLRESWARLSFNFQQQGHWGDFLFVPFFKWFYPRFSAFSFVQARQQEYQADIIGAEVSDRETMASALIRVDLSAQELDNRFWPEVYDLAKTHPEPDVSPFASLRREKLLLSENVEESFRLALERQSSNADTHPSLSDRVSALDVKAVLPLSFDEPSSDVLLGDNISRLLEGFDKRWRNSISPWWKDRYTSIVKSIERVEEFKKSKIEDLSDDDLLEFSCIQEELGENESSFELLNSLIERNPRHQLAMFNYGRRLLDKGDDSGIGVIDAVMKEEESSQIDGCDLIVSFLYRQNRHKEANSYIDKLYEAQDDAFAARQKRETLNVDDKWRSPEVPEESVKLLESLVLDHPKAKNAYLVRKELPDGEEPLHVLGVVINSKKWKLESENKGETVVREIAEKALIKEDVIFIPLNAQNSSFKKAFKKVDGSLLLPEKK